MPDSVNHHDVVVRSSGYRIPAATRLVVTSIWADSITSIASRHEWRELRKTQELCFCGSQLIVPTPQAAAAI
jgi:hypothetical protein